MRLFLTGARGLMGSPLRARLLREGHEVITYSGRLPDSTALQEELKAASTKGPISGVIHLAGVSFVPECEKNPKQTFEINTQGTLDLLEARSRFAPDAWVIFASTAQLYADRAGEAVTEQATIQPRNVYAESKWQAEKALARAVLKEGFPAVTLRMFNHSHHTQAPQFFLPHVYRSLLERPAQIPVGDLSLERDIGSVQDAIEAYMRIAARLEMIRGDGSKPWFRIFNLCSGNAKSLGSLATELASRLEVETRFVMDPARVREGDPKRVLGSCEALTEWTGFQPRARDAQSLIDAFLAPLEQEGMSKNEVSP